MVPTEFLSKELEGQENEPQQAILALNERYATAWQGFTVQRAISLINGRSGGVLKKENTPTILLKHCFRMMLYSHIPLFDTYKGESNETV
jgi:hypothetical protein